MSVDLAEMARRRDNQLRKERRRRKHFALANGQPYGRVDAEPIRQHLRALSKLGWPLSTIAVIHGEVANSQVRQMLLGNTESALRRMDSLREIPLTYRVPASLPPESKVPSRGAIRRVQSLMALGWSHEQIMELTDGYNTARLLASRNGPALTVSAANWRKVDAAFRTLSVRRGGNARTAGMARSMGYVPPAAWDDIDDPRERPKGVAA